MPQAVEALTTVAALQDLAPEWTALWRRDPAATPFQSPAWLLSWWRHLGGGELMVLTRRQAGRLVGVLPLFVWRDGDRRRLLPLGISISDIADLLAEPEERRATADAFLAAIADRAGRWESCEFHELPEGSPLLDAPCPPGLVEERNEQSVRLVLDLARPDPVPRKMRHNLHYYRKRAESLGPLTLRCADAASFETLFDGLVRLHGARWRSRSEPGMLASPALRAFHREAAAALLAVGALRLYGLTLAGRLAAVLYGFVQRGRFYSYLYGLDPALAKQHSPGTLLTGHAVEAALAEGLVAFDFLRGREPYKVYWGAEERPNFCRILRHA